MKSYIFVILLVGFLVAGTSAARRVQRQAQTQSVTDCIRNCPTATSEYNPVCGDNGVTYDNPSKLACAQNNCGVRVQFRVRGSCGPIIPPPPTDN